jgi:hypothetical protein
LKKDQVQKNIRIERKYLEMSDKLHKDLGGNKYRVFEAALDLFNVVHPMIQKVLNSYDEAERKQILEIIGQLKYPPDKGKGGKKS